MKAVIDWCRTRWVWLSMVLLIVILGSALFTTYAVKLPYISDQHAAWATFGSLLAGFFALTSTLATVATLLFLARQNKDMQKVTQAQLATMTFDRYISHRKLFLELLEEQENSLGRKFRFRDPTLLYNAIFPENSLHNCELVVAPYFDEYGHGANHLGRLYVKLDRIKESLSGSEFDELNGFDLLAHFMDLRYDLLMIEQDRLLIEGDVLFHGKAQAFNLFMLSEFAMDAVKLANVIFAFVKSPAVRVEAFCSISVAQTDWLLNELYAARGRGALMAHSEIKFFPDLVWVRASLAKLVSIDDIFYKAKMDLDQIFLSVNALDAIRDKVKLKAAVEACAASIESRVSEFLRGESSALVAEVHLRISHVKYNL